MSNGQEHMEGRDKRIKSIFGWLVLLLTIIISAAGAYFVGSIINNNKNINSTINQNINQPIPSEYPDFVAIKGDKKDPDIKILLLASDKQVNFGAIEGDKSTLDGVTSRFKVTGKLSRAYLFFEGTVDQLPLSAFDDLYFLVNQAKGGHIIIDNNSLPTPSGDTTKILVDLRSVSFYPKIDDKRKDINKQINFDFFSLLTDGKTVQIDSFISSERNPRYIKELSIYYECEAGTVCSLEQVE